MKQALSKRRIHTRSWWELVLFFFITKSIFLPCAFSEPGTLNSNVDRSSVWSNDISTPLRLCISSTVGPIRINLNSTTSSLPSEYNLTPVEIKRLPMAMGHIYTYIYIYIYIVNIVEFLYLCNHCVKLTYWGRTEIGPCYRWKDFKLIFRDENYCFYIEATSFQK